MRGIQEVSQPVCKDCLSVPNCRVSAQSHRTCARQRSSFVEYVHQALSGGLRAFPGALLIGLFLASSVAAVETNHTLWRQYMQRAKDAEGTPSEEKWLIHALDEAERFDPDSPALPSTIHWLGIFYRDKGIYLEALKYFRRELAILEKTRGRQDEDVADSYYSVARCLFELKRFDEALEFSDHGCKVRRNTTCALPSKLMQDLVLHARLETRLGRRELVMHDILAAGSLLNRSIPHLRRDVHAHSTSLLAHLAVAQLACGLSDEARVTFKLVREFASSYNTKAFVLQIYVSAAQDFIPQHKDAEAREILQEALSIDERTHYVPTIFCMLATMSMRDHVTAKTLQYLRQAEQAINENPDNQHLVNFMYLMGGYMAAQKYKEGEAVAARAEGLVMKRNGGSCSTAGLQLANYYAAKGNYNKAEVLYRIAFEDAVLPDCDYDRELTAFVNCLRALGKTAQAVAVERKLRHRHKSN